MNGSNWRSQLFWSVFVLTYACWGVYFMFLLIQPMLPYLIVAALLGGAGYLYWRWRQRDWY